jgi:AraC-like DNA-binding protein
MNPMTGKLTAQFLVTTSQVGLSTARPVRAEQRRPSTHVFPHDHTYYEIFVVRDGRAIHQTECFDAPVQRGSVVVIPPGRVHGFKDGVGLAGTDVYYLAEWLLSELKNLWGHSGLVPLFLAALLFPRLREARPFQFDLDAREYQAAMIELNDIQREAEAPDCSILYLESCFLKFLILLSRSYVRQAPTDPGFQFRREVWLALQRIEEIVSSSQSFSVAALARQVGVSADHFQRIFKEATGWSPSEYFQMRRYQFACKLLLNPENSISDVAYRLGYADSAHLSRVFKRLHGVSPREYRQQFAAQSDTEPASQPGS